MRAVISVIGKDTVGILAAVADKCATHRINITDVTQSVLQDMFVMVMMTDIDNIDVGLSEFADELGRMGRDRNLSISVMRDDIFNAMHTV